MAAALGKPANCAYTAYGPSQCQDDAVSSLFADLVARLNSHGLEASRNTKYGTIDIVRSHGRPLLDPWPLKVDLEQLRHVLEAIKSREGIGTSDAVDLLAYVIEQDMDVYRAVDGPFALNEHGYVVPTRLP